MAIPVGAHINMKRTIICGPHSEQIANGEGGTVMDVDPDTGEMFIKFHLYHAGLSQWRNGASIKPEDCLPATPNTTMQPPPELAPHISSQDSRFQLLTMMCRHCNFAKATQKDAGSIVALASKIEADATDVISPVDSAKSAA